MRTKPFVGKANRKKRIDFAKENEKVDRNFWNSEIFSDESKFNIHGSDGHQKVWRKANAALEPKNMRGTVKHGGGSIMVWGCMTATGLGNLVIIEGIMNQYIYLNILKNNLSQSASKLGLDGSFTFQQDNDPKHTARVVREWLLYNVRKQLTPCEQLKYNKAQLAKMETFRRCKQACVDALMMMPNHHPDEPFYVRALTELHDIEEAMALAVSDIDSFEPCIIPGCPHHEKLHKIPL
ncbi:transposable element Tc1 transposase [Trichonephila clavipes]|nr:transposable element Tc1 transposase [Trichonephila clavipes]